MMALVENGVSTLDNYLTHYFVSVAISIIYVIVLQCVHTKVLTASSANMIGFLLFLFVGGLASGYYQNPTSPRTVAVTVRPTSSGACSSGSASSSSPPSSSWSASSKRTKS